MTGSLKELSSRWSLTSPKDLTGPMALRNPAPARIAPLLPLKGANPLQTTPTSRQFVEFPRCQDTGMSKFLDHFLTNYQNIQLSLLIPLLTRLLGSSPTLFLQG